MERKVLMIAHAFPPCHAVGALRAGKFAKYLPELGWQPIVITREWEDKGGLEVPPGVQIVSTAYSDRLSLFRRGRIRAARESSPQSRQRTTEPARRSRLHKLASFLLKELLAYPDEAIGWRPHALEAGRRVLRSEDIALIFSTSPPATSHVIAAELQRETGLPWVADFRDLWTQNHYRRHTRLRQAIERRYEVRTLDGAAVLVTVSQPLAEKLRVLHGTPVDVITNGFDEKDYSDDPPALTPHFSLTYTGQLYAGKRDPSLLFRAVQRLAKAGVIGRTKLSIRFYGPDSEIVRRLARVSGVEDLVSCEGAIPYKAAVRKQRESTALLLLNWDAPKEAGVYTAKVFEYLGARRPILVVPHNDGVVEELMQETGAGVAARTENEITDILAVWYSEYLSTGSVEYHGKEDVIVQYTRQEQTRHLAHVFDRVRERGT